MKIRCPFCSFPDRMDRDRFIQHLVYTHKYKQSSAELLYGMIMTSYVGYRRTKVKKS